MPRTANGHHLQRLTPGHGTRARVFQCGRLLLTGAADVGQPRRYTLTSYPSSALAEAACATELNRLRTAGYRTLAQHSFEVPATAVANLDALPDVLDAGLDASWAATWRPALSLLADARNRDGAAVTVLALLSDWQRHTADGPWGPPLADALRSAPQALAPNRMLLVGVGARTFAWLRAYYASAEQGRTPVSLPGLASDTDTTYLMAAHLWQPTVAGPLAALQTALDTARLAST